MTLNKERDIILNALYYDFDKHRINHDRILDHLRSKTVINPESISNVLEGLVRDKLVDRLISHNIHDYSISDAGKILIEEHIGAVEKARKEKQKPASHQVNIYNEGGKIRDLNVKTGDHSDFRSDNLEISESVVNNPDATIKPQIKGSNLSVWITILSIIVTVVTTVIGIVIYYKSQP